MKNQRLTEKSVFFVFYIILLVLGTKVFAADATARSLFEQGIEKQNDLDWYGAAELFHEALQQ